MIYQIGDFLRRVRVPVTIEDGESYRLVTIRMNHKGVVLREEKLGSLIGTKTMYRVSAGQFILSGIDARNGAFGVVPDELDRAVVTNDFWYFEIDRNIISKDYFLYLTSTPLFADVVRKASDGTTNRVRLQADKFYTYQVSLPAVSDQEEVIGKLIHLESAIRTVQTELKTQQTLLTQLRQAILQEAVQGKLTERWRVETERFEQPDTIGVAGSNPVGEPSPQRNPSVTQEVTGSGPVRTATQQPETGADLLARIRAEKAELVRQGKLRKEKPLPPITDAEKPFALPEGWVWCRLGEVTKLITDGTHQTPRYTNTGRIFLSAQNIKPFRFMPENHRYVSEADYRDYIRNRKAEKDDVLIARVGAGIGEAAVIDHEIEFAFYVSLGLVKLVKTITSPAYFVLFMNSPIGVKYAKSNTASKGGSAGNFNLERIRNMPVPLPPLAEQQAIVAQVERLLGQVSALEAENRQQHAEVGRLMQVVLREGFAGKETAEPVNQPL